MNIKEYRHYFYDQHELFKLMVGYGNVIENNSIETACISLHENNITFYVNPSFWKETTKTDLDKVFVICHEMCHLFFGHLWRIKDLDKSEYDIFNISTDVYINHFINDFLNIKRNSLSPDLADKIAWVDTVFYDTEKYGPIENHYNKSVEYYFDLLRKNSEENNNSDIMYFPMENISGLEKLETFQDFIQKYFESYESYDPQEIESEIKSQSFCGDQNNKTINWSNNISQKKPWYSVIDKWCRYSIKRVKNQPQWGYQNRRYSSIMRNSSFIFPGKNKNDALLKNKNNICLFLDVSGSCEKYVDMFVSASRMIPEEYFNIKVYVFDDTLTNITQIYKNEDCSIPVGGGTRFDIIANEVNQMKQHPDSVFIITDGQGSALQPKHPEKYFWFLTETRPCKYYIPEKSKIFNLHDFVFETKFKKKVNKTNSWGY